MCPCMCLNYSGLRTQHRRYEIGLNHFSSVVLEYLFYCQLTPPGVFHAV